MMKYLTCQNFKLVTRLWGFYQYPLRLKLRFNILNSHYLIHGSISS